MLRPNQSQQLINLLLDEHGSVRCRDGTLIQGVAAPRPDRPIVKLYDYAQTSGNVIRLAIQLGTFGNNTLFNRFTSPWTAISDFSSVYTTPDIVTFTNLAIIAPGNTEIIRYYDGTTFGSLTGAPNAAHIAVHLNFLWAGNTAQASTSSAGPSSLQCSDLNNPNSWPGTNQTFISKDDGQSIQALGQYTIAEAGISPTSTLIVWKDFSGYEVTGVLGTTTVSVQKIKSDMGCVAPRSLQFISGFGVIRLTHRGFALYDGVNDTLISEEERPRIFGRDTYVGLDWSNISKSMAAQCANPPLYLCACPVSGGNGTLQRVFVYDLVRRAWSILNYPNDLSTLNLSLVAGQLPTVYSGDAKLGYVRRLFSGDTTDDSTAINWTLVSRAVNAGSPMDRSYWRRMLIKLFNVTVGTPITTTFYLDPTQPVMQKSQTVNIPTVPALTLYLGWGADPWGTTPWGSQAATITTDTDLEFPIGVKATNLVASITGSGPGKIRGIEFHARMGALTRSTYVGA